MTLQPRRAVRSDWSSATGRPSRGCSPARRLCPRAGGWHARGVGRAHPAGQGAGRVPLPRAARHLQRRGARPARLVADGGLLRPGAGGRAGRRGGHPVAAPVAALPPLAFDHAAIIEAAVARLRGKSSYSALPAFLLPPLFTLTELHAVYQQVLGTRLDPASFRRKIIDQGIVEAVDGRRVGAAPSRRAVSASGRAGEPVPAPDLIPPCWCVGRARPITGRRIICPDDRPSRTFRAGAVMLRWVMDVCIFHCACPGKTLKVGMPMWVP